VAVLDALPTPDIIQAHKGELDYAVWRGRVYVGAGHDPNPPRSPAIVAHIRPFSDLQRRLRHRARDRHRRHRSNAIKHLDMARRTGCGNLR
jgi:hypothetical protein